jgi:formylglycine-generating enzyme required for sulfatase activity
LGLSSLANIIKFTITGQTKTSIDPDKQTVTVTAPWNTSYTPDIEVSPGAKIDPASGEPQNFTADPVIYTVTAADGTPVPWTVTVVMVNTVTVSPPAATLDKGGKQQFTAVVVGTPGLAQDVTWTVDGGVEGTTIDPAGGELTVAADETSGSLTVTAASTVDGTKYGTATVTVVTVSSVTVNPPTITLDKGGGQKFTAEVVGTGSPAQTVTWTVSGNYSEDTVINPTGGEFTVAADETATSLTVTAASTVDGTKYGTATVTVITVNTVTVSPAGAVVVKGATKPFTAVVVGTGSPAQDVTWKVDGGITETKISAAGELKVASSETATSLTVTAASTVDGTKYGTATVTVPPPITATKRDMVQAAASGVTITGNSGYNSSIFPSGRDVTLSPFYIAKYETTYELWYEVRQWAIGNGYTFANAGREGYDGTIGAFPTADKSEPVTYITWRDAVVWCNAYSEMSGKDPVYRDASNTVLKNSNDAASADPAKWAGKNGYRLPTEAEWEYAARGGGTPSTTGPFVYTYAGSDTVGDVAWYDGNSSNTHPVEGKNPNTLGLHDMSGNVWEWCWDWYGSVDGSTPATGPVAGADRAVRGGSWFSGASGCAVAFRYGNAPGNWSGDLGFRLVLCP